MRRRFTTNDPAYLNYESRVDYGASLRSLVVRRLISACRYYLSHRLAMIMFKPVICACLLAEKLTRTHQEMR